MLQVVWNDGQPRVRASAQFVYPTGSGDAAGRRSETAAAVKQMLSSGRFVGRRMVTALSSQDVQIKNLRLPPMPQEELAAAVRYEAAERFGFDDARTEHRYLPIGTVRSGDQEQQEIALLAVSGEVLRRHLELVSELGLTVEAVDVAPCAAFRPFERFLRRGADADEVNAFVDLGGSGTRIVVVRGREIIFLKAFDVGGERLDALVSEHLAIDPQEARALRQRLAAADQDVAEPPEGPVPATTRAEAGQAIRPAVEQLGKEIGLCLRYCAVTFRGPRCESVTCVGGGAISTELLESLSQAIGVPARKGHPLRNMSCDGVFSMADQCTGQPEWATALGLALKPGGGDSGTSDRDPGALDAAAAVAERASG